MVEETVVTPCLKVSDVERRYADNHVLRGVKLQVGTGEVLAIIGRSGCGKSTLLRCISTLSTADQGNAWLNGEQYMADGRPLYAPAEIRSKIVMVFQEFNLFPNLNGLQNITLALRKTKGMSTQQARELAVKTAASLGIDTTLERYPEALSGGQAQRLALARALVLQPRVLLLDEITSALDPETILNVIAAIRDIHLADTRGEMAIVIVTHLMPFARDFADRIGFLHDGVIWEEGNAETFFTECKRTETREFVSKFWSPAGMSNKSV